MRPHTPNYNSFLNILAKIVAAVLALLLFLILTETVYAQENSGVFAKHELLLDLKSDLSAAATYTVEITNNNDAPVGNFTVQLPFSQISDVHLQIGGNPEAVNVQPVKGGNTLTATFPGEAILTHSTGTLVFTFTASGIVQSQWGLSQLYIGKLTADHIVTDFGLTVDYPSTFPKLSYTSSVNVSSKAGEVRLVGLGGQLIQWGEKVQAVVSENLPLDFSNGQTSVLFNLIQSGLYQTVKYQSLQSLDTAAKDKVGNLWGITGEQNALQPLAYSLLWQNTAAGFVDPQTFPAIDYHGDQLSLPTELTAVTFGKTNKEMLQAIYNYMLHAFSATSMTSAVKFDPADTLSLVQQGSHALNDFQFADITAAYCQKLNLKCVVAYGYLVGPGYTQVDTSRPHVWVEAISDDSKLLILDPYLQVITGGFNFFDVSSIGRLQVGIWSPELTQDSILGLATGAARMRPTLFVSSPTAAAVTNTYDTKVFFPAQVRGGEFYFGYLLFQNDSSDFVPIKSVSFDGQDLTTQLLQVTPQLKRVMMPFTSNRLDITWQRDPNFLVDETKQLHIELTPDSDVLPVWQANTITVFVPNAGALVAGIVLSVVAALAVLLLGVHMWMQQMKINWRLRERYLRRVSKKSHPIPMDSILEPLPMPQPKTVHRIHERD